MRQYVRIIGGELRGKKITFPFASDLRPTPNRVRETLFNWLMHDIHNSICLDLFGGSGALGFEAFSRKALEVIIVEKSSKIYQHLCQIVRNFKSNPRIQNLHIVKADALNFLSHNQKSFDIIFLDPPFSLNIHQEIITAIIQYNTLKIGGLLYAEAPNSLTLPHLPLVQLKEKRTGNVYYYLYKRVK